MKNHNGRLFGMNDSVGEMRTNNDSLFEMTFKGDVTLKYCKVKDGAHVRCSEKRKVSGANELNK